METIDQDLSILDFDVPRADARQAFKRRSNLFRAGVEIEGRRLGTRPVVESQLVGPGDRATEVEALLLIDGLVYDGHVDLENGKGERVAFVQGDQLEPAVLRGASLHFFIQVGRG